MVVVVVVVVAAAGVVVGGEARVALVFARTTATILKRDSWTHIHQTEDD